MDVVAAEKLLPEGRITCTAGMTGCPRSLKDDVAAYNAFNDAGLAMFVVGGVSFVGMITYVIWPGPSAKGAAPAKTNTVRVHVAPVVGPGLGGVVAGGSF
jgi:hypothetical protein